MGVKRLTEEAKEFVSQVFSVPYEELKAKRVSVD